MSTVKYGVAKVDHDFGNKIEAIYRECDSLAAALTLCERLNLPLRKMSER